MANLSALITPSGSGLVTLTNTQTISNKTLISPIISGNLVTGLSPNSGISGQVLTSQGSGLSPEWTTISGVPDYILMAQGVI